MISGYDNVIFSTTKPVIALNRFAVSLDKKWADFLDKDEWELIINDQDINLKGTEFFFCKDSKMFSLHDEMGYSTDSDGEGCFYLIVKFMKSFAVKATIEQEIKNSMGDFNRDPYSSIIVLEDVYEYTIVTPVSPDIDEFSAFLMAILTESLLEKNEGVTH